MPEGSSPETKLERIVPGTIKLNEIVELEEAKQDLEARLTEATNEIKELNATQEVQEKIVKDKERQARSDKK